MTKLTTHVLDTAHGSPAEGMRVCLYRIMGDTTQLVNETTTNDQGRTDEPLLEAPEFLQGMYRIEFHVADYFIRTTVSLPEPAFLDVVPICLAWPTPHRTITYRCWYPHTDTPPTGAAKDRIKGCLKRFDFCSMMKCTKYPAWLRPRPF